MKKSVKLKLSKQFKILDRVCIFVNISLFFCFDLFLSPKKASKSSRANFTLFFTACTLCTARHGKIFLSFLHLFVYGHPLTFVYGLNGRRMLYKPCLLVSTWKQIQIYDKYTFLPLLVYKIGDRHTAVNSIEQRWTASSRHLF